MSYAVFIEGLQTAKDLANASPEIVQAAYRAINEAARFARAESVREMQKQVNFPARYLNGNDARLRVAQFASSARLEATIIGRQRPTSLARFAISGGNGRTPVTVAVKPGRGKTIRRSFLMKLRTGNSGELNNLGLAVRTAKGERPANAYKPAQVAENLWLLYGPSVDQVFKSVRSDVAPKVAERLEREFNRLLELGR